MVLKKKRRNEQLNSACRSIPKTGEHDFAAVLTLDFLFRSEMDFVMNTARRCGLSDADAEDVTQQVFLALQRRLHTNLQSPESSASWLVTVTRRYARTKRGTKQEEPETLPDSLGEIEDEVPLAEEQILRSERRREVLDLLEEIDPVRRAVLVMHVLERVPTREVAEALQIPISDRVQPPAPRAARPARGRESQAARGRLRELPEVGRDRAVRHLADFYYGRTAITQEVRDRIWARVLDAIRADVRVVRVRRDRWPPRRVADLPRGRAASTLPPPEAEAEDAQVDARPAPASPWRAQGRRHWIPYSLRRR